MQYKNGSDKKRGFYGYLFKLIMRLYEPPGFCTAFVIIIVALTDVSTEIVLGTYSPLLFTLMESIMILLPGTPGNWLYRTKCLL